MYIHLILEAMCYALWQAYSSDIQIIDHEDQISELATEITCLMEAHHIEAREISWYYNVADIISRLSYMMCPECGQLLPAEQTKCNCTEHGVYLVKLQK